jgi:phosphatidylethanolamine/phosphatidyl-N-methylethanolamine N-methyltransferase
MGTENGEPKREQVYNWWNRHPRALNLLYGVAFLGQEDSLRQQATEALDLIPDERVLEVGCGNGNSFASLRTAVDSNGTIVGLDASRGMVRSAHNRIQSVNSENVHVVRGDAQRPPFSRGRFDAAYASMSLSAVPNPKRAIDTVETLLRPGGRFVVLDAQPFQRWPWRLANPLVVPVAERTTNWEPQVNLPAVLQRTFETVAVETFNAGSIFVACARKQ